jgi:hypothetical protein
LPGMKLSFPAGNALHQNPGAFINKYAHRFRLRM